MPMRHAKATLTVLCLSALALAPPSAMAGHRSHAGDAGGTPAGGSSGGNAPTGGSRLSVPTGSVDRATVFGPGFYGRRTACGTLLSPDTVGVAHRSMACGTRVAVSYGGRRIVVPVIDRGPYVVGITWDLTTGAARALQFPGTGAVGTAVLGSGSVPAG